MTTESNKKVWYASVSILALVILFLLVSFFFPLIDLTGNAAYLAYLVTESGGKIGDPILFLFLILVVISRPNMLFQERIKEAMVIGSFVGVVLLMTSYANEHVFKPMVGKPRPFTVQLESKKVLKASVLYAMPTKKLRSAYLGKLLNQSSFKAVALQPAIKRHWIKETGFSFPSGHSMAAFMLASFFLTLALFLFAGSPRRWIFYLVVLWAVGVCFSRVFLRVHDPVDIFFGALEGTIVGIFSFAVVYAILWREQDALE